MHPNHFLFLHFTLDQLRRSNPDSVTDPVDILDLLAFWGLIVYKTNTDTGLIGLKLKIYNNLNLV